MTTDNDSYDFFVSYARDDNATGWITRFVEELLAEHARFVGNAAGGIPHRGMKPFFDQHAITTGADWQLYLAHGVSHSRLFLAFISPNYFASEWCRKEWRAWIDAEIAQHILTAGVRPIYIVEVPGLTGKSQLSDQQLAQQLADLSNLPQRDKDKLLTETPPVLKHLRRRQLTNNQPFCDVHAFFDAGLDAIRRDDLHRVLNDLAHDVDLHAELLAKADASLSTVPAYNKNFTGRLNELLALRERLIKDDRTGVIYGVHGLGGIGKSELAFAYAHAYASAYPGGQFLIRCEGKVALRDTLLGQTDFTALFRDRINDEERKQPDSYFAAVLACLRGRLDSLGHVLLVLDNVTDLALLSPEQTDTVTLLGPKLHLLATTRLVPPTAGKGNWLSLGRLPDEDALDLLEKHRPFATEAERDAARRIAKRLGGFTLVIELVAAWLAKHREVTCEGFLKRLGMEDIEALNTLAEENDVQLRRHNDERRLAAVLDPTLVALVPIERRAMEYAALLPPDHVPLPWLRSLVSSGVGVAFKGTLWKWLVSWLGGDFSELEQQQGPGVPDRWQTLVDHLTDLTLFIRPDSESSSPRLVTVHRMVQDRVRAQIFKNEITLRRKSLGELVKQRWAVLEKTTAWEDARWELEPLEAIGWLWAEENRPEAACQLRCVAQHLFNLGVWSKAEPLIRRALAINERRFGPDHPEVAVDLNDLAALLQITNRLTDAEPLMRRALAINEKNYGSEHPGVALVLGNLATLLQATNRQGEAEPLFRRALAIVEKCSGPEHPRVALFLSSLATLLRETNRLAEAEPMYRRALAINEKTYGPEHPSVGPNVNGLATLLQVTNRLTEAEPLFRRTLAIDEKCYGLEHPETAIAMVNLGHLLTLVNRHAEAEPLFRRALPVYERIFGSKHPETAAVLGNLSELLQSTNRLVEAEPLIRRALAIYEQSYGPRHPRVATSLTGLAKLLKATNRLPEAEPLVRRALAIDEQSYGPDHPDVARDLNNLAVLLHASNRLAEAEPVMWRALAIEEQNYSPDHPDVARDLNSLATLLQATDRLAEAEPLFRRALAIKERCYGPEHPAVAVAMVNLAVLLTLENRHPEAEPLYRRALPVYEASFGPGHPEVATALTNLATLLQATNRLAEAEPMYRRALAIDEQTFGPDNPKLVLCLNNLTGLLQADNRLAEAEPLLRRMLEIVLKSAQVTGQQHPNLEAGLNNYANLLRAMGRREEEIRNVLSELTCSFGMVFQPGGGNGQGGTEPSAKLRAVLEQMMREPEKGNEVAVSIQSEDPSLYAELVQWFKRQQPVNPPASPQAQIAALRRQVAQREQSLGPTHAETIAALNQLAKHLESMDAFDDAEAEYRKALDRAPSDVVVLGNYAFFRQNFRRDFPGACDLYRRALHADPADAINHTNYAGLCLIMGATGEAVEHLGEAWRLVGGKADRYTARTLFLRAALAVMRSEVAALFLGQLRTIFDRGIQPMPSRNIAVRDHLQQNLSTEQFTLFEVIYAVINEPDGLARLSALPVWQAIPPRPLDEPWP